MGKGREVKRQNTEDLRAVKNTQYDIMYYDGYISLYIYPNPQNMQPQ